MIFIGQYHIMHQLGIILRELYKNPEMGCGFLLVGPSGYGKTTMALSIAKYLVGKNFEYYLGTQEEHFLFEKHVIFIDEVHTMKNFETLYPILDAKEQVLILATNENGGLPEPLRNRCYEFIFDDYDDECLLLIARDAAPFSAPDESFMSLVEAGNRNPREIKSLVDRFGMFFSQHPEIDSRVVNFRDILRDVFLIENGLDTLSRRYLEVLEDVGGNASLALLKNILHVPAETIQQRVEPILLRKGLIEIRPKGRILL